MSLVHDFAVQSSDHRITMYCQSIPLKLELAENDHSIAF